MIPIEEDAFKWVEKYIKPDMNVFEYGSGGSTLYFGNNVQLVVSIEDSRSPHTAITPSSDSAHGGLVFPAKPSVLIILTGMWSST